MASQMKTHEELMQMLNAYFAFKMPARTRRNEYRKKVKSRTSVDIKDAMGCGSGRSYLLLLECGHTVNIAASRLVSSDNHQLCTVCYLEKKGRLPK